MKTRPTSPYARLACTEVRAVVDKVLAEILRRGFYGKGNRAERAGRRDQQIRRRVEQFVQQ